MQKVWALEQLINAKYLRLRADFFSLKNVLRFVLYMLTAVPSLLLGAEGRTPSDGLIISSFTIPNDWVGKLLPKHPHRSLIPPQSEIHGYQLSPRDAKDLSKARLIIGLSPELEPWLASWVKANQKEGIMRWLSDEEQPHAHEGHSHDDPHLWTDPRKVLEAVGRLRGYLKQDFPGEDLESNYQQVFKEYEAVDKTLQEAFQTVPPDKRVLITQHPNLGLFAKRYGLTVAGTIVSSSSAEAADPSARHFAQLLAMIKARGIRVIVVDAGQNSALAQRLAQDAGLPEPLALSFEALAPPGQEGSTWAAMMLRNGRLIQQALLRP